MSNTKFRNFWVVEINNYICDASYNVKELKAKHRFPSFRKFHYIRDMDDLKYFNKRVDMANEALVISILNGIFGIKVLITNKKIPKIYQYVFDLALSEYVNITNKESVKLFFDKMVSTHNCEFLKPLYTGCVFYPEDVMVEGVDPEEITIKMSQFFQMISAYFNGKEPMTLTPVGAKSMDYIKLSDLRK